MLHVSKIGESLCFPTNRIAIAISAALILSFTSGCGPSGTYTVPRADEESCVTSPNGDLDAVLVREDGGGAPGGWDWDVYIVAKGLPVVRPRSRSLFEAGTLTDEKLMWSQEHLLEIHYDIAEIDQFTNIWDSSEIQHDGEERDNYRDNYFVEIRLVPSGGDFSLLTPNGKFRQKH
jgi:hypothetical protein